MSGRYIDADAIKYFVSVTNDGCFYRVAFKDEIDKIPTADVVEVVRCKDCVYNGYLNKVVRCKDCEDYDSHTHQCKFFNHGVVENDYCSRVIERREDAEKTD